jgi:hypothetical protein
MVLLRGTGVGERSPQDGLLLITETMGRRDQLPMGSYDRLFPNQDTMPRGGFGNLIALPLQHGPRQQGNAVFVNEAWTPYADQWAYLAGLPRIEPSRVNDLAIEATARGQVIGVVPRRPLRTQPASSGWSRLKGERESPSMLRSRRVCVLFWGRSSWWTRRGGHRH